MTKRRVSKQTVRQTAKRQQQDKQQKRRSLISIIAVVAVGIIAVAALFYFLTRPGGDSQETAGLTPMVLESKPLTSIEPVERNDYYDAAPEMIINTDNRYEAVIHTEKGDIRLRLFDDEAPLTVNNFVFLANQGFYDDTIFHRVIQDFMAQGGDPTGTGTGGPGYSFADETDNGLSFDRPGLLAMANRGANTNGSQFFVTYEPVTNLDGRHTIFGELIEGEDVLNSLSFVEPSGQPNDTPQGDRILGIDILED